MLSDTGTLLETSMKAYAEETRDLVNVLTIDCEFGRSPRTTPTLFKLALVEQARPSGFVIHVNQGMRYNRSREYIANSEELRRLLDGCAR